MMCGKDDEMRVDQEEVLTVYVPTVLLADAMTLKSEHESLTDVIVQALDREVRRRQGLRAIGEVVALREQIARESGPQTDSTALIRELRDGR